MAGIGLDASVVRRVQPSLKKRIGKGAFWISGLSHLATWNPRPFTIEINDDKYTATFRDDRQSSALRRRPRDHARRTFGPARIRSLHHSKHRAGIRYLRLLSHAMRNGMPRDKPEVCFVNAVNVKAYGDAAVQIDGELIGHLPMRFEIAPHSLEVIVP